ncbi:MAG: hypothetical protein ACJ74Q_04940 [Pyrinomonadaceae bacterium]|jgi:uncharacterized repeat protein (TIGR01451 family)
MIRLKKKLGAAPLLALCAVVILGGAAFAQRQLKSAAGGRPEVKVELTGSVERAGQHLSLDRVENVKPGEVLDWQILSSNDGSAEARDYKTVGHIPSGTTFVAGSANAESGSTVTYSIDGGQTYSSQPVIEERQPDGTVKRVAAPVSMYTEVRYEWSDALAAGGKLSASYKVRVR